MAIFGNFKGTTQSGFKIGKADGGNKISTGNRPSTELVAGDLFIDSSNTSIQVYNSGWVNLGSTLPELNVDDGTLFVDSSNDTVSIGSTSSNDKLFVNGSLRLGTNPVIKYSGARLDVQHTNGTGTNLRIRDNSSGSDPIFKVFNANNTTEVFKVSGNEVLHADNVKAKFGTGGDLEIYHDGSNSYIDDAGTGSIRLRSGTFTISNAAGSKTSALFSSGGSQDLYHNNNKKFETTNSGIQVTGTVNVNGAYTLPNLDVLGTFSIQEDYGLISQAANVVIDMGVITNDDRMPTPHDSYTVAEANSLSYLNTGDMIFVSNESGGATMAFYDGTNWRRIQDRAVIS